MKTIPEIKDYPKHEDDPKNKDYSNNENFPKNEWDRKIEEDPKMKTTRTWRPRMFLTPLCYGEGGGYFLCSFWGVLR